MSKSKNRKRPPAVWPPMTPRERAKALWIYSYARESFSQVRVAVNYIEENKISSDAPIFLPLVTAIYANYSKPFLVCHGAGPLPPDFVEEKDKVLHEEIIRQRHRYFCHRDTESDTLVIPGDMNQVQFFVSYDGEKKIHRTGVTVLKPLMPRILEIKGLVERHDKKCRHPIDREVDKLYPEVPHASGHYTLNFLEEDKPLFLPFNPTPPPHLRM